MANSTMLTGRLTEDPKVRKAGELDVSELRIAVQRRRGRGGEDRGAFFIDVVTFNGQATSCAKYLHKGSRVLIDGQLDVQEWTGRDDKRHWTPKVIAEQVEFLDPPPPRSDAAEQAPADEAEQAEPAAE